MGACCSATTEQGPNGWTMQSNMRSARSTRLKLSPTTFIPRKKIWVIVQNSDYSLARQSKSLKTLYDVADAQEKVNAIKEGISNMGGTEQEIRIYKNATRKDLVQIFDGLNQEVRLEQTLA